jgi:DNA-binding beta-propeller fold protein YncE
VSVINSSSNKVTSTIKVGQGPLAVANRNKTGEVYVANFLGDSISVISTSTMKVVRTFKGASHARDIEVNGLTGVAYVANMNSSDIWSIGG